MLQGMSRSASLLRVAAQRRCTSPTNRFQAAFLSSTNTSAAAATTTATNTSTDATQSSNAAWHWLDLRGSGLSILERLLLEECLWRHDKRNWLIVGTHEGTPHRYLQIDKGQTSMPLSKRSSYTEESANPYTAIVLGIGGKPNQLLNLPLVTEDQVITIKRFSGGGTVVVDADCLWTTMIGRPAADMPPSYPREIMAYTFDKVFEPWFKAMHNSQQQSQALGDQPDDKPTMVLDIKSCSATENTGRIFKVHKRHVDTSSDQQQQLSASGQGSTGDKDQATDSIGGSDAFAFALRENDYIWGQRKIAGNAQAMGHSGWLHHTSFLFDYSPDNMAYLTLPSKRPAYREDRSHSDFLTTIKQVFANVTLRQATGILHQVANEQLGSMQTVTLPQAMQVVDGQGGLQEWYDNPKKGRTRILTPPDYA
jgi:lipoate-protein ligase A